jgi:predicted dinucleotide-binding enzyme
MMKKVGIIGSGVVGKTLAAGFSSIGYEVMLGSRDTSKVSGVPNTKAGTKEETADFASLIVLAVKGTAAIQALDNCKIDGKIIIDTTNPIADQPPVNGVLQYFTAQNDSLGEQLQRAYPRAHFVKAFNSVGHALMVNPDFGNSKPTMFICGNSNDAKREVEGILGAFGWEPMDMGSIEACRAIEPLCMLWCIPGFKENSWTHAFKLLMQ